MPTHTPKLLGNVEVLLQNKLKESLAQREELVVVATGLSKAEADRTLHKLRAMRAGLKQYQPVGSELQLLASAKHIRFTKVYEPSKPDGRRHTVYIRTYAVEVARPSDAVTQSLKDFYAGLRSTPF